MSRRERLLAAATVLFQRYGFRKTTVEEIAREAGIGKGSVYLEFSGKEEVFLALVEEHERQTLHEVQRVAPRSVPVADRLVEAALVRPRRNVQELARLPEVFEILASLRGKVAARVKPYQDRCLQEVADLIRLFTSLKEEAGELDPEDALERLDCMTAKIKDLKNHMNQLKEGIRRWEKMLDERRREISRFKEKTKRSLHEKAKRSKMQEKQKKPAPETPSETALVPTPMKSVEEGES